MFLFLLVGLNCVKPLNDLLSTAFKTLTDELSAIGEKTLPKGDCAFGFGFGFGLA